MAAITGLSSEQCQALAGVEVGTLLLVQRWPKGAVGRDDDDASDERSEASSVWNEESVTIITEVGEAVVLIEDIDDSRTAEGYVEVAATERSEVAVRQSDGTIELVADGNEGDGQATGGAIADGSAVDDNLVNARGDGEDAGEEEEEEEEFASVEDEGRVRTASLFKVCLLERDDTGYITDIVLCNLTYCSKPAEAASQSYHIYGQNIVHGGAAGDNAGEPYKGSAVSIKDVVTDIDTAEYTFLLKPTGDDILHAIFPVGCPARCVHGWVPTQEEMHAMVTESITSISDHSPVCPVCVGKDLMGEYQSMRETLDTFLMVDMTTAIDFYGRLNARRRSLGYPFQQFDEREWGYLFDDMLSEDENDGDQCDSGQYEQWAEAMDPNSGATYYPASATAIAALPRKIFADVVRYTENITCAVCMDKFKDDTVIAELPCGHIFCDPECAEQWLKQSNSCPTCRTKLPNTATESEGADSTVNDGDVETADSGNPSHPGAAVGANDSGFEDVDEDSSSPTIEKDGEDDIFMSDDEGGISWWDAQSIA